MNLSIFCTFLITCIVAGITGLCSLKHAAEIAFITTIFTGTAFCKAGTDNTILSYYIVGLIFILKWIYWNRGRFSIYRNVIINSVFVFFCYCFISIFFVFRHKGILIDAVSKGTAYSSFSFQQFTQWAYLAYAVLFMYVIYDLLNKDIISVKEIWNCLEIMFLLVIFLGFIQLIVPREQFNFWFQNDAVGGVVQNLDGHIRLDSTFGEPSFLALFYAPINGVYFYQMIKEASIKKGIYVLLGLAVFALNHSSSFLIGYIFMICMGSILAVKSFFQNGVIVAIKKAKFLFILFICLIVFGCVGVGKYSERFLIELLDKLNGIHSSGQDRKWAMMLTYNAFRESPWWGIGFGTMRSLDLLSSWLGQLGIVGFSLWFVPIFCTCVKLLKKKQIELFILLAMSVMIMLVSVPEFRFLYFWVYLAMAAFVLNGKSILRRGAVK